MPYYTEEQIMQARSIDLLTYLQSYEPTELVHVRGDTYCTREYDSLKSVPQKANGCGGAEVSEAVLLLTI